MRAAVCPAHGGPEVVEVREVDGLSVGPGQVRIGVSTAAVNYPDVLLVAGTYQMKVPPPFVPGSELAGEVLEVGEGVEGVAVGDRVIATMIVGAFAEEAVVGASQVQPAPAGVDLATAAAFGVAHRTAYHALRSFARVQPGDEVVVLGAGGGVGLAAVQLAHVLGGRVTAVASSAEKLSVASSLGAASLIDHREGDLRAALRAALPNGADVVIDPVGGDLSEPALRSLRWGGRFVVVGFAAGSIPRIPLNLVLLKGIQVLGFQFLDFATREPAEQARNDAELLDLLVSGRAVPHIGARFPLSEAAAALATVAEGRAVGKVIIDVRS